MLRLCLGQIPVRDLSIAVRLDRRDLLAAVTEVFGDRSTMPYSFRLPPVSATILVRLLVEAIAERDGWHKAVALIAKPWAAIPPSPAAVEDADDDAPAES